VKILAGGSNLAAHRWLGRGLALGWLLAAPGVAAAPPSKQECAQAYAETQSQSKANKLRTARAQALLCAQPSCPGIISKDCRTWLEELERNLPTVVLGARGATGQDVALVHVTMDGEAFAARLDGDALPVDPGEHSFHFELDGSPAVDIKVVIRVGERNRRIDASFTPPPAPAPAPAPAPPEAPGPANAPLPVSPAVFVLGGIAVVGLGVFATFGTLGENQKSYFDSTCVAQKQPCPPDAASSVRTKLIIGDVGLFTALAAVGVGTTVFFVGRARPSAPAGAALRLEIAPVPSGGLMTARGSF